MSDGPEPSQPRGPLEPAAPIDDQLDPASDTGGSFSSVSPADIGSASRSCLVILILGAAILLILCVSLAIRAVF
jgi:hypothetical protein